MEVSGESMKYTEDKLRPVSSKFVELHVLFAPADLWNMKLNKVPAEATEGFISAGFIRVFPETTLQTLRGELGALLGSERSIHKFSFLKCVGRSLALVKSKQETDLKVKTFAPPYAAQPELYLLHTPEADSNFCPQSFTLDSSSSSPEQQACPNLSKMYDGTMGTKKPIKFPHITQCSRQRVPGSGMEEGHEDEEGANSSTYSDEALSFIKRTEPERCEEKPGIQRAMQLVSLGKALETCEADPGQAMCSPENEETWRKTKHQHRDRLSGAAESLEDGDLCFLLTDRYIVTYLEAFLLFVFSPFIRKIHLMSRFFSAVLVCFSVGKLRLKDRHTESCIRKTTTNGVLECPAVSSQQVQCTNSPQGPDLASSKAASASLVFLIKREDLMEEIKLVREERKQLEWTRQQLLWKGKDLLAQNRHRRNQARDTWKKKYFETKKATTPLEEHLRNLRQELEIFYNKVLHQLQAREKARRQGRSSEKNELIIQIMRETQEIDNLKRKLEDSKMKLITEIKLKEQAATELRDLKAELAQKKNSHLLPGWGGNTSWSKTQVKYSFINVNKTALPSN
ncbi:PREDICTED: LOW QUALITY PROTEIN: spermatogenesis-associated protein 1 [Cyprinodon variegatus]|uniref:LOW QUALITY PROTEIN: spermatogenesis-associated protein 1 n=1 Tax=Cyprinodon variegatus TaxID=28743 RepID=UPI000742C85D|nr:PREDICTED: LOW QUALITY PROTEIN: spermatogenesis-associated protein 1 [Cyprinodon variegatus]